MKAGMEQRIIHACGHEQAHYLTGFATQQDRKARWLQTTQCRTCFITAKKSQQADAAAHHSAAIAHLDLPALAGSDRQVTWAASIRTGRLAMLVADSFTDIVDKSPVCSSIADAKWWIDTRDLSDEDFLQRASTYLSSTSSSGIAVGD